MMPKRPLSIYFIAISLITAVMILSSGVLITWIERSILSKPLYQSRQLLSTDIYFQMIDYTFPGQTSRSKEILALPKMLSVLFGVDITDPIAVIKNEIPINSNRVMDQQAKPINEQAESPVPHKSTVTLSSLTDEAPVLAKQVLTNPAVLVYHTHSRESWYSEASGGKSKAVPFHASQNITLVGKEFANRLEKIGIPVYYDDTDHDQLLVEKNKTRAYAYAVSADTVVEAISRTPEINYIFDFHRDAVARKFTTTTIDGIEYAKIMFVIGKGNRNWKENFAFAEKLQAILDERYPGLCRAIAGYEQNGAHNGEYNQSFSSNALTVEIGGIENTLEESLRTVTILADVFAEIYLEAVPVNTIEAGDLK